MGLTRTGAVLSGLAGIGFGLLGRVLPPPGPYSTRPGWVTTLTDLAVPLVALAVVLYLADRGTIQRALGESSGAAGGLLGATADGPVDRWEIVAATNWKRLNWIRLRRSLGVALTVAGAVALVVSLTVGAAGGPGESNLSGAMAALWFGAILFGLALVLTSRTDGQEVSMDYTHRVSVRIPDLFSLHSFHVHLRQITEDLGYVPTETTSPGRGGSVAAFDEEMFLSKGGFKARKRPFESSLSPLPDDSPMAEVINLTTASLSLVAVGASLVVTGPRLAGLPPVLVGGAAFLYDYVRRTRQWAELYCVEEGTVYTPTANVHDDDDVPDEGVVHREPAVSAAESSTELLVTLGAKHSTYFEAAVLAGDFEDLVERLDDVAAENSYSVVDEATRDRLRVRTDGR
ncbi:MAG: hypothetical protein ABEJ26_01020 [Halosimplex sp.]